MTTGTQRQDQEAQPEAGHAREPEISLHDQHPMEPAEGALNPGETTDLDIRAHPSDPAEGPRDSA